MVGVPRLPASCPGRRRRRARAASVVALLNQGDHASQSAPAAERRRSARVRPLPAILAGAGWGCVRVFVRVCAWGGVLGVGGGVLCVCVCVGGAPVVELGAGAVSLVVVRGLVRGVLQGHRTHTPT